MEQIRLPPKPRLSNVISTTSTSKAASQPSHSQVSRPPDTQHSQIPQWQLQIICGPGHDHNNFDSQRPGTKFKVFEAIGEQIWRPSNEVLDEQVQDMSLNTSLNWSDFLRFRVLEETTPWEHWYNLYSKEHYGRKPLMPDCYLTHGWNKQSKTPVWLPREVKNFGTLRKILEKWFPSPKDKVTMVFEYINKDHLQISTTAPITRFKDQSIEPKVFDQAPEEYNSANHPSPSLHSAFPTSDSFPSSPPFLPTSSQDIVTYQSLNKASSNYDEQTTNNQSNDLPILLISSSSSELPTIEKLIATRLANTEINKSLIYLPATQSPTPVTSSSLSTIPDTPDGHPLPQILVPIIPISQAPSHRSKSKVLYIFLFPPLHF